MTKSGSITFRCGVCGDRELISDGCPICGICVWCCTVHPKQPIQVISELTDQAGFNRPLLELVA
jgi:hypothetical protein